MHNVEAPAISAETVDDISLFCWEIRVRGTVQGVGFRPAVFQLANRYSITGQVINDGEGVLIHAWSDQLTLSKFVQALPDNAPPLARIASIQHRQISQVDIVDNSADVPEAFIIGTSGGGAAATNISADAAACRECLDDVLDPTNRRFRYPFTNCTNCGPRLSIIRSIPYDRVSTCMDVFPMCKQCKREYDSPADRRFHAQPNACLVCGPKVWLERGLGPDVPADLLGMDDIATAANLLENGFIIAIKGIGGFHLACDATNQDVVCRLRQRKYRFDKPFALMARDISMVRRFCPLTATEEKALTSSCAPIVVLNQISNGREDSIATSVAPGQNTLGFMLPYSPMHHLLLQYMKNPIVLTSGNRSSEPQCIENEQAREKLVSIADYYLLHNRDIINRLDDSVVRMSGVSAGNFTYLRRGRGVAPEPIFLPPGFENAPEILALGGELKSTFCLTQDGKAIVSQHIGDLEDATSFDDFIHNLEFFTSCFNHSAVRVAIDLHPEYLSGKLGRSLAQDKGLTIDEVQHHHAHIAACLADNSYPLSGWPVLGVTLDGLGWGDDSTFWGGEFLLADYRSYQRLGKFKPVALLGGTQAMKEPWRNTYSHLMAAMEWSEYKSKFGNLELTKFLETKPLNSYSSMLKARINTPMASSCGRLFDAVAAAVGICQSHVSYEGQAAIELEALVDLEFLSKFANSGYQFEIVNLESETIPSIVPTSFWHAILHDLSSELDRGIIAAKFHQGLADVIVQMVQQLCSASIFPSVKTVALSGGVFQNKILERLVYNALVASGFEVLVHRLVPANDGGLSLGQALISAAQHINKGKV